MSILVPGVTHPKLLFGRGIFSKSSYVVSAGHLGYRFLPLQHSTLSFGIMKI